MSNSPMHTAHPLPIQSSSNPCQLVQAMHARELLTPDAALCYGVGCPTHGECARYVAIDGVLGVRLFIDTCKFESTFPLFVEIKPKEDPAMSEHVSTGERYVRASTTSNLRMRGETEPCDADKLLAAGYAQRGSERKMLGLRLYRMQNAGDLSCLSAVVRHADAVLRIHLSRKGGRPMPGAQRDALVVKTLQWWLSQRCEYCNGTGFDTVEGAPALSMQECAGCGGTRITPLKRLIPPRLLVHAYWLTKEWDVMCAEVIGDMAQLLALDLALPADQKRAQYGAATNAGCSGNNTKQIP